MILFIGNSIGGCISLQISKVKDGTDVPPPPQEFRTGKTSLQEVLSYYGAPTEIVHMKGPFALYYRRTLYRSVGIAIGIPWGDVLKATPNLDARGNLSRYDEIVFVFTPEGVLKDLRYEKGATRPLWRSFWQ